MKMLAATRERPPTLRQNGCRSMSDCIAIHKAYQFKLEPTAAQETQFWRFAGAKRWVYNAMLAQRKAAYQAD